MTDPILLDRRKLFEQVAAHLEREILEGKLRAGDRLPPERELQSRFGVGRPAIREALITLQRAGLVEIGNGMPARVSMPTMQGVVAGLVPTVQHILSNAAGQRQLQGVRLFVEVGLVRHAAASATADDLRRLSAALDDNRKTIGDLEAFIRTDVAFHFAFAEITKNPAFVALHDAMSTWLLQQRRIALQEPDEDRRGYDAHESIYEAVVARDPDAAERAMREHLESGWVAFWHRYPEKSPESAPGATAPAGPAPDR
jgi:GntR family transcriptional regulator, sialic acid-inducible nan operon repressor